jgi:hypothetical protein
VDYPPHLLDELARIFAKVALDRLLRDELAPLPGLQDDTKHADSPSPTDTTKKASAEGLVSDKSSD